MCSICTDLQTEIRLATEELRAMPCGKRPLKHPHRKAYLREYYQKNREKKLAAAKARYAQQSGQVTALR